MKLTGLEKPLVNFAGEPLTQGESEPLTMKAALLGCLMRMKADQGAEAIHVYKLGTQVFGAAADCPIDSADMALLKHAVEQNGPEFLSFAQGQLLMYLESVDQADKK